MDVCGITAMVVTKKKVKPKFSKFISKEERLKTFKNWPSSMKQTPEELAEAGFFYLGYDDNAVCFYCGLGCKCWKEEDTPWEEHELWSPDCKFLLFKDYKQKNKIKEEDEEKNKKVKEEDEENKENDKNKENINVKVANKNKEEDNTKLICKVCYEEEINTALYPCGHTICLSCVFSLNKCHICRSEMEDFFKIYF